MIDNDEGDVQHCPYCANTGDCEHLMLLVYTTFRDAEGGSPMRTFNDRWHQMCDVGGDDFDEREAFDTLLEEIDAIADASTAYDMEGGPGMSSSNVMYFVKSANDARDAVARFADDDTP